MRRRLFGLAAIVFSLIIGLVIAEIVLRLAGYSQPEFYQADETFGYSLIPGMSGNYAKEGRSFVSINSHGFRDIERSHQKGAGVFRIAVIGDSYVEGFQVEADERFTKIAENLINRDCGTRVEIIPFGVSGYGTAQQLLLLRDKVLKYSPDAVVLLITSNNDITDNSRELKRTPIPYFVENSGELVLDNSFRDEKRFVAKNSAIGRMGLWLRNRLRVVQAIDEFSTKFKYWYKGKFRVSAAAPVGEVGIDNEIYREPANETWQSAWRITERLIEEMQRSTAASGSRFYLVTATNGVQVLPDINQRETFARALGAEDLSYPNRRIAKLAESAGIASIDLVPVLGEHAASNKLFLHGFENNLGYGHWNQSGHRVAGEAVASFLCTQTR